jgi:hypothetical protein
MKTRLKHCWREINARTQRRISFSFPMDRGRRPRSDIVVATATGKQHRDRKLAPAVHSHFLVINSHKSLFLFPKGLTSLHISFISLQAAKTSTSGTVPPGRGMGTNDRGNVVEVQASPKFSILNPGEADSALSPATDPLELLKLCRRHGQNPKRTSTSTLLL